MPHKKLVEEKSGLDNCPPTRQPCQASPVFNPVFTPAIRQFLSAYVPRYFEHEGEKLHFIDTGIVKYERTILCLHSRYGWAYSFRKIVPKLIFHGFRVVLVDLLGFGLSGKPEDEAELSIRSQSARVQALIEHLDLTELTLIGHEMGATIAAQIPQMAPERIDALVLANPANCISKRDWPGLHMWRTLTNAGLERNTAAEIARVYTSLTDNELEAYQAPLQTKNGLFGVRHFHDKIALDETDPDFAFVEGGYRWLCEEWTGRNLILASTQDPIFGIETAKEFCEQIGCSRSIIQLEDTGAHPFEQKPECIDLAINELFAAR